MTAGRRLDEGIEEAVIGVATVAAGLRLAPLRVPLHPDHPGVLLRLHRLDQSVLRPHDRSESGSEVVDPLVVEGVDEEVGRAEDLGEARILRHSGRVPPLGDRRILLVDDPLCALRGEVLEERPAQRHVQELDQLERAIIEGARVQVTRRGTEYTLIPRTLRSEGTSEILTGTTNAGDDLSFALDEIERLEIIW